jgi:hypothetical protein
MERAILRSMNDIQGFTIGATDGDIGRVDAFYFDDTSFTVRPLVVDTSGWLTGRKVLISPMALRAVDWDGKRIEAELTKSQVEQSPDIDTDQPVSRQQEINYHRYYGYPSYSEGLCTTTTDGRATGSDGRDQGIMSDQGGRRGPNQRRGRDERPHSLRTAVTKVHEAGRVLSTKLESRNTKTVGGYERPRPPTAHNQHRSGGLRMRTSEAFILGTVLGGVAVWLWGREIEGYVTEKTRGVRRQAADAMRAVEERTGQVLDGSGSSLRRAEGVLQDTKERVSTMLRAGQDAIRPAPTTREA